MLRPEAIERALVVMAHPDDVDFGAAGTVATLTETGAEVTYCLVTDGDAGGFDPAIPRSAMGPLRREEQRRAAKEVGVESLVFLGHADGRVVYDLALRRDIARVIRQVQPQVVLAQSPVRNLGRIYSSHPDHLATGQATIDAVYPDARNPYAYPELVEEGLAAWTVGEIWILGGPEPNGVVDVTDQVERKMRALMCHESQHPDPERTDRMVREWMGATAAAFGLPEGRHAEAFQVVDAR